MTHNLLVFIEFLGIMRPLPPVAQVLPIFRNSFDATLTKVAKTSWVAALILPLIGAIFGTPLMIATRCGMNRDAEKSPYVVYGFAPLATVGIGACMVSLCAIAVLATSILLDLTHVLVFKRHALDYRAVFFPFKFNFIDYNALIQYNFCFGGMK